MSACGGRVALELAHGVQKVAIKQNLHRDMLRPVYHKDSAGRGWHMRYNLSAQIISLSPWASGTLNRMHSSFAAFCMNCVSVTVGRRRPAQPGLACLQAHFGEASRDAERCPARTLKGSRKPKWIL